MEYANETTQHLDVNKVHWIKPVMGRKNEGKKQFDVEKYINQCYL